MIFWPQFLSLALFLLSFLHKGCCSLTNDQRIDDDVLQPPVFGLLGAQLFGGKFDNASSRANFDSFQKSYLAVFQVLCMSS